MSKLEQQMQLKDTEDDSATIQMTSMNSWQRCGRGSVEDAVGQRLDRRGRRRRRILRTHSSQSNEGEKSCISTEITTVELRANGRQAEEQMMRSCRRPSSGTGRAWRQKDEKRYIYMMLRNPGSNSGTDEPGNLNRLYKRYELSEEDLLVSLLPTEEARASRPYAFARYATYAVSCARTPLLACLG